MSISRRFRFGAQLPGPPPGCSWEDAVGRIEELGYSTLSMPDHLGAQLAPIPALAAAAMCSSRLRLTMSVLANDLRHPAMLAHEVATLDRVSAGRVELGLGTGWMTEDYSSIGRRIDAPSVRIARLSEAVDLLRLIWDGGAVEFHGQHYDVEGLNGTPSPVQHPLPLMLGGAGQRMLELAATKADIVSIGINAGSGALNSASYADASRSAIDRKIAWIREAAGDRWDRLEIGVRVFRAEVTGDPSGTIERHATELGLAPDQLRDSPHFLLGSVDQLLDALLHYREELGISYYVISAASALSLAPVVQQLVGT